MHRLMRRFSASDYYSGLGVRCRRADCESTHLKWLSDDSSCYRERGGWRSDGQPPMNYPSFERSLFLLDGQGQQHEALGHSMGDAGGATYHAKGGTNSLRISSDEHWPVTVVQLP